MKHSKRTQLEFLTITIRDPNINRIRIISKMVIVDKHPKEERQNKEDLRVLPITLEVTRITIGMLIPGIMMVLQIRKDVIYVEN